MDFNHHWYQAQTNRLCKALLPLSWMFAGVTSLRRLLYQQKILRSQTFDIPIIVCGNLTVGGTGKTPLVMWLANFLRDQGFIPGIVSRGSGGIVHYQAHVVDLQDEVNVVGDEALMLKAKTQSPMVICADRAAAVNVLLQLYPHCNVIISDDGLQHYRLARDIEIVMIDGMRRFGNQRLLPAGPLREPIKRAKQADFVIVNGGREDDKFVMHMQADKIISLQNDAIFFAAKEFPEKKIHVVAAIGNPQRFFSSLQQLGFEIIPHIFPDHYLFQEKDLEFLDDLPIVMTEKDAIKCRSFAKPHFWYLATTVTITGSFPKLLLQKLTGGE